MVSSSAKYEFDDLAPLHFKMANAAKVLKVAMLFVFALASGLLVAVILVNEKATKVSKSIEKRMSQFNDDVEGKLRLDQVNRKYKSEVLKIEEELKTGDDLHLLKNLANTFTSEWIALAEGYLSETKPLAKMAKRYQEDYFTNVKSPSGYYYPRYYSKYMAGYVVSGCHSSTCTGTSYAKPDLESCLDFCSQKRKDGVFSVTFDINKKKCYCSTEKYLSYKKVGFLHYRFPRF